MYKIQPQAIFNKKKQKQENMSTVDVEKWYLDFSPL
jgi:hypothetical protein